jgi:mono/diheme cytochrome c family protein
MKAHLIALSFAALCGCASSNSAEAPSDEARGQALAATHCASCHAIGRVDASPAPEAPPFRTLSRNYRVSMLQEALAEGISVGHPAMPEFQFAPDDVDALIAYLESVQERPGN